MAKSDGPKGDSRRSPRGADGAMSRRQAMLMSAALGVAASTSAKADPAQGVPPDAAQGAYAGFQGRVGRTALTSQPWWPPEKRARAGAPNILVFLFDDLGYADLGCFGSEIATPNVDRLAAEGVRYSNFHVEPTCSPTRAALLTGMNPHAVGFGFPSVTGGVDPGFPGYAWQLPDDVATSAEVLRNGGYATLAVGKWHLSRPIDVHESMSTTSWPTRRGFDRYYGAWGDPNQHLPDEVWDDNHIVPTDKYEEGYFYSDDLAEKAISMIQGVRQGDPDKPFYMYFAFSGPHAPINAPAEDIAKYKGRYDAGWDAIREQRFARQKELGLVDQQTRLPPRNSEQSLDVPAWADVPEREKQVFARYMEVYAGLVDRMDQCIGRIRSTLEEMGEWENTIVIVMADNGASREGAELGGSQYGQIIMRALSPPNSPEYKEGQLDFDYEAFKAGLIGGPQTLPHYPRGWAMAGNTPFRLYKADTFCGGHQVPFIFSWPAKVRTKGEIRRQYAHVTDVLPTLLDLTEIPHPAMAPGSKTRKMTGVTFARTLWDAGEKSRHIEQYTESAGSRRYYRDGWAIVTSHRFGHPFDDSEWQLYDLAQDPTEIDNLAEKRPDLVRALSRAWEKAAWDNQVFPMNDGSGAMFLSRAPYEDRYAKPVTLFQGAPTVPSWRTRWLMDSRSFAVRTRFSHSTGDEGTLFKHGGQGGGYGLFVVDGRLRFILNGYGRMTEIDGGALRAGDHEVVVRVAASAGLRWDVELLADGVKVASSGPLPMLYGYAPIGGIDVGVDRRSPISWRLYERHGAFAYGGRIRDVTYEPGAWAPDLDPKRFEAMRRSAMQGQ